MQNDDRPDSGGHGCRQGASMNGREAIYRLEKSRTQLITPERFTFACHNFTLRLKSAVSLPEYTGDIFHRALGKGLEQISPHFGQYFFHPRVPPDWPDPSQTPPVPFMPIPPMGGNTDYYKGENIELGITLFGHASQQIWSVFAALEKVGKDIGLVDGKGHFDLIRLNQITPNGLIGLFADEDILGANRPTSAAEIFAATPAGADRVTLKLITYLRLKDQNRLTRQGPAFAMFMERLLGRINTLSVMYCGGLLLPPEEKITLTTLARTAAIACDNTQWLDWKRPAGNGKYTNFGGLVGEVTYGNIPAALLPWLSLGQWIGVGGKTSFGLGLYELGIEQESFE